MLNYIKSELYRAFHSGEIRETAMVITLLVFLMNHLILIQWYGAFSVWDYFFFLFYAGGESYDILLCGR